MSRASVMNMYAASAQFQQVVPKDSFAILVDRYCTVKDWLSLEMYFKVEPRMIGKPILLWNGMTLAAKNPHDPENRIVFWGCLNTLILSVVVTHEEANSIMISLCEDIMNDPTATPQDKLVIQGIIDLFNIDHNKPKDEKTGNSEDDAPGLTLQEKLNILYYVVCGISGVSIVGGIIYMAKKLLNLVKTGLLWVWEKVGPYVKGTAKLIYRGGKWVIETVKEGSIMVKNGVVRSGKAAYRFIQTTGGKVRGLGSNVFDAVTAGEAPAGEQCVAISILGGETQTRTMGARKVVEDAVRKTYPSRQVTTVTDRMTRDRELFEKFSSGIRRQEEGVELADLQRDALSREGVSLSSSDDVPTPQESMFGNQQWRVADAEEKYSEVNDLHVATNRAPTGTPPEEIEMHVRSDATVEYKEVAETIEKKAVASSSSETIAEGGDIATNEAAEEAEAVENAGGEFIENAAKKVFERSFVEVAGELIGDLIPIVNIIMGIIAVIDIVHTFQSQWEKYRLTLQTVINTKANHKFMMHTYLDLMGIKERLQEDDTLYTYGLPGLQYLHFRYANPGIISPGVLEGLYSRIGQLNMKHFAVPLEIKIFANPEEMMQNSYQDTSPEYLMRWSEYTIDVSGKLDTGYQRETYEQRLVSTSKIMQHLRAKNNDIFYLEFSKWVRETHRFDPSIRSLSDDEMGLNIVIASSTARVASLWGFKPNNEAEFVLPALTVNNTYDGLQNTAWQSGPVWQYPKNTLMKPGFIVPYVEYTFTEPRNVVQIQIIGVNDDTKAYPKKVQVIFDTDRHTMEVDDLNYFDPVLVEEGMADPTPPGGWKNVNIDVPSFLGPVQTVKIELLECHGPLVKLSEVRFIQPPSIVVQEEAVDDASTRTMEPQFGEVFQAAYLDNLFKNTTNLNIHTDVPKWGSTDQQHIQEIRNLADGLLSHLIPDLPTTQALDVRQRTAVTMGNLSVLQRTYESEVVTDDTRYFDEATKYFQPGTLHLRDEQKALNPLGVTSVHIKQGDAIAMKNVTNGVSWYLMDMPQYGITVLGLPITAGLYGLRIFTDKITGSYTGSLDRDSFTRRLPLFMKTIYGMGTSVKVVPEFLSNFKFSDWFVQPEPFGVNSLVPQAFSDTRLVSTSFNHFGTLLRVAMYTGVRDRGDGT